MESFLNRNQSVRINSITSNMTEITSDLPQVFILGPLFLLCMNNLLNYFQADTILYDGDTNIVVEANSIVESYQKGNYMLTRHHTWLFHNICMPNTNKKSFLTFNSKNKFDL